MAATVEYKIKLTTDMKSLVESALSQLQAVENKAQSLDFTSEAFSKSIADYRKQLSNLITVVSDPNSYTKKGYFNKSSMEEMQAGIQSLNEFYATVQKSLDTLLESANGNRTSLDVVNQIKALFDGLQQIRGGAEGASAAEAISDIGTSSEVTKESLERLIKASELLSDSIKKNKSDAKAFGDSLKTIKGDLTLESNELTDLLQASWNKKYKDIEDIGKLPDELNKRLKSSYASMGDGEILLKNEKASVDELISYYMKLRQLKEFLGSDPIVEVMMGSDSEYQKVLSNAFGEKNIDTVLAEDLIEEHFQRVSDRLRTFLPQFEDIGEVLSKISEGTFDEAKLRAELDAIEATTKAVQKNTEAVEKNKEAKLPQGKLVARSIDQDGTTTTTATTTDVEKEVGAEAKAVHEATQEEQQNFVDLKDAIAGVTGAIERKIESIKSEREVTVSAVQDEIDIFNSLLTKINETKNASSGISETLRQIIEADRLMANNYFATYDRKGSNPDPLRQGRVTGENLRERSFYASSLAGVMSTPFVSGDDGHVTTELKEATFKHFQELTSKLNNAIIDTYMHSHPNLKAAFSHGDLNSLSVEIQNGITKYIVTALDEVSYIDVSKIVEAVGKNKASSMIKSLSTQLGKEMKGVSPQTSADTFISFLKGNDIAGDIVSALSSKTEMKNYMPDVSQWGESLRVVITEIVNSYISSIDTSAVMTDKDIESSLSNLSMSIQDKINEIFSPIAHKSNWSEYDSVGVQITGEIMEDYVRLLQKEFSFTNLEPEYQTKMREVGIKLLDNILKINGVNLSASDVYKTASYDNIESLGLGRLQIQKPGQQQLEVGISPANVDNFIAQIQSQVSSHAPVEIPIVPSVPSEGGLAITDFGAIQAQIGQLNTEIANLETHVQNITRTANGLDVLLSAVIDNISAKISEARELVSQVSESISGDVNKSSKYIVDLAIESIGVIKDRIGEITVALQNIDFQEANERVAIYQDNWSIAADEIRDKLQKLRGSILHLMDNVEVDFSSHFKSVDPQKIIGDMGNAVSASADLLSPILAQMIEAERIMERHSIEDDDTDSSGTGLNLRERFLYYNSKTGAYTNPFLSGSHSSVSADIQRAAREYFESVVGSVKEAAFDTFMHSHPEHRAGFSSQDIRSFAYDLEQFGITKQINLAQDDLGVLNLQLIIDAWRGLGYSMEESIEKTASVLRDLSERMPQYLALDDAPLQQQMDQFVNWLTPPTLKDINNSIESDLMVYARDDVDYNDVIDRLNSAFKEAFLLMREEYEKNGFETFEDVIKFIKDQTIKSFPKNLKGTGYSVDAQYEEQLGLFIDGGIESLQFNWNPFWENLLRKFEQEILVPPATIKHRQKTQDRLQEIFDERKLQLSAQDVYSFMDADEYIKQARAKGLPPINIAQQAMAAGSATPLTIDPNSIREQIQQALTSPFALTFDIGDLPSLIDSTIHSKVYWLDPTIDVTAIKNIISSQDYRINISEFPDSISSLINRIKQALLGEKFNINLDSNIMATNNQQQIEAKPVEVTPAAVPKETKNEVANLKKHAKEIRDIIQTIIDSIDVLNSTSLNVKKFSKYQEALSSFVQNNSGSFAESATHVEALTTALESVITKITEKNDAFTNEAEHVKSVVDQEISYFDALKEKISSVINNEVHSQNIDVNLNPVIDSAAFVAKIQKAVGKVKIDVDVKPKTVSVQSFETFLNDHRDVLTSVINAESTLLDGILQKIEVFNNQISTGVVALADTLAKLDSMGITKAPIASEGLDARIKQIRSPVDNIDVGPYSEEFLNQTFKCIDALDKMEASYRAGLLPLKELKDAVKTYAQDLAVMAGQEDDARARAESLANAQKDAANKLKDIAKQEAFDAYIEALDKFGKARNDLIRAEYSTKDNSAAVNKMRSNVDELREALSKAREMFLSLFDGPIDDSFKQTISKHIDDILGKFSKTRLSAIGKFGTLVGEGISKDDAITNIQDRLSYLNKLKIAPVFESDQLVRFVAEGENAQRQFEKVTFTLDKTTGSLYSLSSATKKAANNTGAMSNFFRRAVGYFTRYVGMYMSAFRIIQEIRNGLGYVRELDTALTELQVVTKETDDSLASFAIDAYDVADSVASTTAEIVKSSTEWARLGYDMNNSLVLASQSAKLAKTGFMEVSEATEQLTASIEAFYGADIKAGLVSAGDAATHVSDELVALGNQMPITSQGLGAALERSAGSLVAAGNTIEEAVALLATANATIQNPESIGIGFKTVAARLRGTKVSDIANDGDIDIEGMATDASKLYSKIKQLTSVKSNDFQGISILTDTGAYKSTYQILKEIADVWKEMNDLNQAALLEEIAGKRQAAAIAAVMNNPELLEEGKKYADEASGATDEAMDVALDSIDAKLAQLKNNWQAFWQDLISSDVAKDILSFVNSIVKALDKVVKIGNKLGTITPLSGIIAGGISLGAQSQGVRGGITRSLFGSIQERRRISNLYGSNIKTNGTIFDNSFINTVQNTIGSEEYLKSADKQKFLIDSLKSTGDAAKYSEKDIALFTRRVVNLGEDAQQSAKEVTKQATSMGKLGSVFKGISGMLLDSLVAMGVSFAISMIIKVIDNYINRFKKAADAAKEFKEAQENITRTTQDNIKTIEGYSDRFETLSRGVDEYGNNVSLTAKEFEEYKNIVSDVVSMSPKLAKGYSQENGYLVEKNRLLERAITLQKNEQLQSLRNRTNTEGGAATEIYGAGSIYQQALLEYRNKARKVSPNIKIGELEAPLPDNTVSSLNAADLIGPMIASLFGGEEQFTDRTVESALRPLYEASKEYADSKQDFISFVAEQAGITEEYNEETFFDDYADQIAEAAYNMADSLQSASGETDKEFEKLRSKLYSSIEVFNAYRQGIEEANIAVHDNLNAVAQLAAGYNELSAESQRVVSEYVQGVDVRDVTLNNGKIDEEAYNDVKANIRQLVSNLERFLAEDNINLEDLSKLNIDQYYAGVDDIVQSVKEILPEGIDLTDEQIELALSLVPTDENGNKITSDQMRDTIERNLENGSLDIEGMSFGSLKAMYDVTVELVNNTKPGEEQKYTQEYLANLGAFTVERNRIMNVEHSSFTEAQAAVTEYSTALTALEPIISNGISLSEDQYKSVIALVGAEADLSDILVESGQDAEGNTKYVVKNKNALNSLIQTNKGASAAMKKVADGQDQARRRYSELTNEIYKTLTATKEYDHGALSALFAEADAVHDLIDDYAKLEQQIMGNTKAFDDFAAAKAKDETNTYANTMVEMYNNVATTFKSGMGYGTEAFQAAMNAILPEDWEGTVDDAIAYMQKHFKELRDKGLISVNDSGDAFDNIDYDNVKAFVNEAIKAGALIDLGNGDFEVAVGSIEEFAEKMKSVTEMSVTEIEAFIEAEAMADKYGRNIWEQLIGKDNINYLLHQANQELLNAAASYEKAVLSGDQATIDAAQEVLDNAKANLDEYAQTAVANIDKVLLWHGRENELLQEIAETQAKLNKYNELPESVLESYDEYIDDLDRIKELGYDISNTDFGNIHLGLDQEGNKLREVIEWTDENLAKFGEALKSWEEYDFVDENGETVHHEFNADEWRNTISTVYGGAETFGELDIAFSPMLQTGTGTPVLMTRDSVMDYIQSIIDIAGQDGEVTLDEVLALDRGEGLEVPIYFTDPDGNQLEVHNLIADIGDTAIDTSEVMHYLGSDGAIANAYDELVQYAAQNGISGEDLLGFFDDMGSRRELQAYLDDLLGTYNTINMPIDLQLNVARNEIDSEIEELENRIPSLEKRLASTLQGSSEYGQISSELSEAQANLDALYTKRDDIIKYLGEDQEELAKVFDIQTLEDADGRIRTIAETVIGIGEKHQLFDTDNIRDADTLLKALSADYANDLSTNDLLAESADAAAKEWADNFNHLKMQYTFGSGEQDENGDWVYKPGTVSNNAPADDSIYAEALLEAGAKVGFDNVTEIIDSSADAIGGKLDQANGSLEEIANNTSLYVDDSEYSGGRFDPNGETADDNIYEFLSSVLGRSTAQMSKEEARAANDWMRNVNNANAVANNIPAYDSATSGNVSDDLVQLESSLHGFVDEINRLTDIIINDESVSDEERASAKAFKGDIATWAAKAEISIQDNATGDLSQIQSDLADIVAKHEIPIEVNNDIYNQFLNVNGVLTTTIEKLQEVDRWMTTISEKNITINSPSVSATSGSNGGSQHADGYNNAYANGKNNDLVGELGTEIWVDRSTGRWHTVGENGPEFINVDDDDIIFNHRQTEDLLKRGHAHGRGRALVDGNAYAGNNSSTSSSNDSSSSVTINIESVSMGTAPNGIGEKIDLFSGSSLSKMAAAAEETAKDWVEAFKKAQEELERQYKVGEISFDDYMGNLQALYNKYYEQYGSKSKEEMKKLHDAWTEMYNNTQSMLDSRYTDGEISLKDYLNNLQRAYQMFYANTEEYAKERAEAEKNYIKQMKSAYESLFSAANTVLQHQIDAYQKQKDAADKAYDKQIKGIQKQIDHYQDLIDAIEKQKEAIQDEIDEIQKANEERQRAIDLQKAQYELARAQNQRTQYVYTSNNGFVYRTDPNEIRDKRQELENQKTEARVAELQKEIDKLDEAIEKYQDQIDIWQKQIDAIEKLKEASDEYFDNLIEQLELQQEKWSEFQQMMELAQAISVLESFGLTVQDVFNSTDATMQMVKDGLVTVMATISKDSVEGLNGLAQAAGKSFEEVQGMVSSADAMAIGFSNIITGAITSAAGLGSVSGDIDKTAESLKKLSGGADATAIQAMSDAVGKLGNSDVTHLADGLTTLSQNAGQLTTLNTELDQLLQTLTGIGENTAFGENGILLSQFQTFCNNFMAQAQQFKNDVTTLFGGMSGAAMAGAAAGGAVGGGAVGSGGWFDSFVAQVEALNERTQGPMAELTAQWNTLRDAIQSIIGEYSADEDGEGEGDESSILGNFAIGSEGLIVALQQWTDSLMEFQAVGIEPVAANITSIIENMCNAVVGACLRASAAIHALQADAINASVAVVGVAGPGQVSGTANVTGTAYASGSWGLKHSESGALVGELGQETVVDPGTGRYYTVGDTGAEFVNLPKGAIVFNHKQTEQLFKYGKITGRGHAYANGNLDVAGFRTERPALWDRMLNMMSNIDLNIQRVVPDVSRISAAYAGIGSSSVLSNRDDHSFVVQNLNVEMPNFNSDKADALIKDLNTLTLKALQRYH